jgi:acetyl esterase
MKPPGGLASIPIRDDGPLAALRGRVEGWGLAAILGNAWVRRTLARKRSAPIDGRLLDERFAAMLTLDDMARRSDLRGKRPAAARAEVAKDVRVVDLPRDETVERVDVAIPGPAGSLRVRYYTPPSVRTPSPALVYVHGGGWVTGSIETHDGLCTYLAAALGCRVLSPEYRLAPEHRHPAAVDDVLAVTRWVLEHAEELGIDPARVAAAGDSAGGNLSAVIARRTANDTRRLALQVLLYPALDGSFAHASYTTFAEGYFLTRPMCDWYYDHYVGPGGDRRAADVSPLLARDVSRVPALIYTAGFDPLRDEGAAYAERLRGAGTRVTYREFPDVVHGFLLMRGASESGRRAAADVVEDIRRELFA